MIVQKIREGRGAVLIQWFEDGRYIKRGWIPYDALGKDLTVDPEVLSRVAPFGMPFERILPEVRIAPEEFAEALHRNGIWTFDDVMKNPNDIARSLLACMGWYASQVQTFVREFNDKKEESSSG
jgi:hypothetical protein